MGHPVVLNVESIDMYYSFLAEIKYEESFADFMVYFYISKYILHLLWLCSVKVSKYISNTISISLITEG